MLVNLGGPLDPDTTPQVSAEATTLFVDDLSTLNNFTTGGTAPTTTNGVATFASSTTASAASYMRSVAVFVLRQASYLRPVFHVKFEAAAVANVTRWWGIGLNQGSPTAAAPVVNGAVFELRQSDGALYAVIYSAGTRVEIANLTRPTDAAYHRYEIYYRQSRIYWSVDGAGPSSSTGYATVAFPNLAQANNLALVSGQVNATTAPSTAPTLLISNEGVADHSGTTRVLGDQLQPWVGQTVKQAQSPTIVATDNPAFVLALPPASQYVTQTAAAATAVTVTLGAPAAGLRHYVTSIAVTRFAAAALTAASSPVVSSASNHTLVMSFPSDAAAQGAVVKDVRNYFSPLASTAQATATSFTLPATTNVIWRVSVGYYVAP